MYASDWGSQTPRVFVDDMTLTGRRVTAETSFESGLGRLEVTGPPGRPVRER